MVGDAALGQRHGDQRIERHQYDERRVHRLLGEAAQSLRVVVAGVGGKERGEQDERAAAVEAQREGDAEDQDRVGPQRAQSLE
jgi:hypothetical protein